MPATTQQLLRPTLEGPDPSKPIQDDLAFWARPDQNTLGVTGSRHFIASNQDMLVSNDPTQWDIAAEEDYWVGLWVQPKSLDGVQTMMFTGAQNSGNTGFHLQSNSNNIQFILVQEVGTQLSLPVSSVLSQDVWFYILVTVHRAGLARIYINGVERNTMDVSGYQGAFESSVNALSLGARSYGLNYVDAYLSKAVFAKGFLPTDSQIQELYNFGNGKTFAELSFAGDIASNGGAAWNLMEATQESVALDATGNGNDATPNSGELVIDGDMSNPAAWDMSTGWSINGGIATKTPGEAGNITQDAKMVVGLKYTIGGDVLNYTAGWVNFLAGSTASSTPRSANGSYSENAVCSGNGFVYASGSATFGGAVDNLTVRSAGPGPAPGPRESRAADIAVGANHGTLIDFPDPVTPWSNKTPDGSYTPTYRDSYGSDLVAREFYAAEKTNFNYPIAIPFGTDDFSIDFWFYAHSLIDSSCPWSFGRAIGGGRKGVVLLLNDLGGASAYVNDGVDVVADEVVANAAITAGNWHHVVLNAERGALFTCYLDGVEQLSIDISAVTGSVTSESVIYQAIGSRQYTDSLHYFDGRLSRLRARDRLLTPAEITESFNNGWGVNEADLSPGLAAGRLANWELDETSGPAIDSIAGNDGVETFNNFVTDPGFDDPAKWIIGADWEVVGSKATKVAGTSDSLRQGMTNTMRDGVLYEVGFDIVEYNAGQIRPLVGNGGVGTYRSGIGTYTEQVMAAGALSLYYNPDISFDGSIDNAALKATGIGYSTGVPIGLADGTMIDFDDVDLARSDDTPDGTWGNIITDRGSGDNTGLMSGPIADSRSANVPRGSLVTSAFDAVFDGAGDGSPAYDATLIGFTGSTARSSDIPASLSGVKSLQFGVAKYADTKTKTLSGQGARSISFWFKRDGNPSSTEFIYCEASSPGGAGLLVSVATGGHLTASIFYAGGSLVPGGNGWYTTTVCDNNWHQIVFTWDGTTDAIGAKVYVDGLLYREDVAGITGTTQGGESSYDAMFSGYDGTALWSQAAICDPRIYAGRTLTPAEVNTLFTGGDVTDGQTFRLPFNEEDTNVLDVDWSLAATDAIERFVGIPSGVGVGNVFSIEGFVQTSSVGQQRLIDSSTPSRVIFWTQNGNLTAYLGSTADSTAIGVIAMGTWAHAAMVKDGTSLKLYVNGILHLAQEGVEDATLDGATFTIGSQAGGGGSNLVGFMANMRVHDTPLSQANIRKLAQGLPVSGAVGSWQFDDKRDIPYVRGNKSLIYDGNGTDSTVGILKELIDTSQPFSHSAWVNFPSAASTTNTVASKGAEFQLYTDSDGSVRVYGSVGGVITSGIGTFETGIWVLATFTSDGTNRTLYINGVERASDAAGMGDVAANYFLGSYDGISDYANGLMIDHRVYTKELSAAEVLALATGTDVTDGLLSRWAGDDPPRQVPNVAGGMSLYFDVQSYVALGQAWTVSTDWTISFWVKAAKVIITNLYPIDLNSPRTIFGWNNSILQWYDGSSWQEQGTNGASDGAWYHFAVSKTGTSYESFLNGLSIGGGTCANIALSSATSAIGAVTGGAANHFPGWIDDVRAYGTNLLAGDILQLYNGIDPTTLPESHWPLDDGPQEAEPSNGDVITSLTTREGRSIIFNGVSANQRPQWASSLALMNNRPALFFDGLDDCLEALLQVLTGTEGAFFFAAYFNDVVDRYVYGQGDTGSSGIGVNASSQAQAIFGANAAYSDIVVQSGQVAVVAIARTAGVTRIRIDKMETVVSGTSDWFASVVAAKSVLGAWANAPNDDFASGFIADWFGYERPLSEAEVEHNEDYLIKRYTPRV